MMQEFDFILLLISVGATLLSCILPLYIQTGLMHLKHEQKISKQERSDHPKISVIVAAHNEEKNIAACLSSLVNQDYPDDRYEIIIVNDRSTDATGSILKNFEAQYFNLRVVEITKTAQNYSPKKYALDQGIKHSSTEILFFTDADCTAESRWLSTMIKYFSDDVGVVMGFSPVMKSGGLLNVMSRLETFRTAAIMFGFTGNDNSYMSVGRNWAYRKQAYRDAGEMQTVKSIVSGDDDLLLQQIVHNTRWKVRACLDKGSFVWTRSTSNIGSYIRQKMRHFSASVHYPFVIQLAFGLSQLISLICLLSSILAAVDIHLLLLLLPTIPFTFCFVNITHIASHIERQNIVSAFAAFIFEPIYVVVYSIISILGIVTRPSWS